MSAKIRIEADARSWNLSREKTHGENSKTPGATEWMPFRYYATLEQAALGLLNQLTLDRTAERTDAESIIAACRQATQDVIAAVTELEARGIPTRPDKGKE